VLLSCKSIKMKNNPWNKNFIEYDGVHNLYQEFDWLTQVH
jgi:hypothetical protein